MVGEGTGGQRAQNVDQVIGSIREFGDYLGDEIAVSVSMDEKGEPVAPLVLAELKNSAGFQQFIEQQIAKYAGNAKGTSKSPGDSLRGGSFDRDGDRSRARQEERTNCSSGSETILFAASPKLNQLQDLATISSAGRDEQFHRNSVSQSHRPGLSGRRGFGGGCQPRTGHREESQARDHEGRRTPRSAKIALKQLGILNLKYFVLDQNDGAGKTHTQATVSFSEAQRGIPSWLADPGPMGSLEYISPDANVVAGFVVRDPVKLVDDLLGVIETVSPDLRKNLDKQQADRGLDIRKDIAAPLGGEFAFAIDGPILPTPSWKMVFEVNDSAHLQQTLERIVG